MRVHPGEQVDSDYFVKQHPVAQRCLSCGNARRAVSTGSRWRASGCQPVRWHRVSGGELSGQIHRNGLGRVLLYTGWGAGWRSGAILWSDHAVSTRAENSPLLFDPWHLIYGDELGQVACLRVKI